MTALSFGVLGVPAPAGSKKGYVVGGRVVLVNTNAATQKAWRQCVSVAAYDMRNRMEIPTFTGPVTVTVEFRLPRPKSTRKNEVWKHTKPDLDKLLRSTLDGLTDAGVFTDDALVVHLTASKRHCRAGEGGSAHTQVRGSIDDPPGAHIRVATV